MYVLILMPYPYNFTMHVKKYEKNRKTLNMSTRWVILYKYIVNKNYKKKLINITLNGSPNLNLDEYKLLILFLFKIYLKMIDPRLQLCGDSLL
jgi:hypothetical protein